MKTPFLFLLLSLSVSAIAQNQESFYVFDADWKPTKIDSAHFLLHVHQMNDTCWRWDYYNFSGPLLRTEQYRDKDAKEFDGVSYHYNENGWLDSTSSYKRGKKNGDFVKMSGDSLKWQTRYVYRDDSLIEVVDCNKPNKDSAVRYKDEKESEYPGGAGKWLRYLNKNLKYPERAISWNIDGEVRIWFIVNKDGGVEQPY
ncbi:energy transducer TonB [Flavitalea flava]